MTTRKHRGKGALGNEKILLCIVDKVAMTVRPVPPFIQPQIVPFPRKPGRSPAPGTIGGMGTWGLLLPRGGWGMCQADIGKPKCFTQPCAVVFQKSVPGTNSQVAPSICLQQNSIIISQCIPSSNLIRHSWQSDGRVQEK